MEKGDVTQLLRRATGGSDSAVNELMHVVYDELRALARHYLARERPDHTLQSTALVHEAYLKLVNQDEVQWQDRAHFFAVASRVIRQILVDHARAYRAAKRGGEQQRIPLDTSQALRRDPDLLALEDALTDLARLHPRQAEIVTLRFFGGLTIGEVAEVIGMSQRTVDGDWQMAKVWLSRQLRADAAS